MRNSGSSHGHLRSAHPSPSQYRNQGRGLLPLPSHWSSSNGSNTHSGPRPTCQVCGKLGHTTLTCYRRFDHAFQAIGPNLTAYTTTSPQSRDLNWYPDTGATHHLTFDLNNLNIHSEAYDGIDAIQVGNGSRLAIKNTNISKLFPNFILHNILHVPKITENLLSVQNYTSDNNVYMEFHSYCFFC
jgi:hypothetical protein